MTYPIDVSLAQATAIAHAAPMISQGKALGRDRLYGQYVLEVSTLAAGATLDAVLETADTASDWTTLASFPQASAIGAWTLEVLGCKRNIRAHFTAGAGDAVVSLTGVSEQSYCTPADIATLSLPSAALAAAPLVDQIKACLAATDEAASYLAAAKSLPIKAWGNALRLHTANMAAYHTIKRRGFNPDNDPVIRLGYTDAIAWLKSGAKTDPSIIGSEASSADAGSAYVVSREPRGWYD